MRKLIIIPAYNEAGNIEKTVQDIMKYAQSFDYIVVNDASTDRTMQICRKNGYNILNLPVNMGIGGAVQTGYLYALQNDYDVAVQFDGDGQHNARYLEKMARHLADGEYDMVIGSRFIRKEGFQSSGIRRVGIRYFSWLIRLMTRKSITDPTSGMRMVNREILALFSENYPRDYPEPETVTAILKMKKRVSEIPVIMNEREEGRSSISKLKSVYYMIKVSLAICISTIAKTGSKS